MNTKNIPALVTLFAGLVAMIVMMLSGTTDDMLTTLVILLVVLIIFFILGSIIKLIFDRIFADKGEETEDESEDDNGVAEDIQGEEQSDNDEAQ